MITLQIKYGKAKVKLDLPEKASEMRLRQYIDFIRYYDKWLLKNKEFGLFSYESIIGLSTLLAKFFEVDVKSLIGLKIDFEDFTHGAEVLSKSKVHTKDVTDKLMSVVCFIKNVVDNLKPRELTSADCHFDYKGEKYCLPYFMSKKYLQKKVRPSLDLGQLVEMHEIQRVFSNRRAKEEREYLNKRKAQLIGAGHELDDDDDEDSSSTTTTSTADADILLLVGNDNID